MNQNFERDVDAAAGFVSLRREVWKWSRVAGGAHEGRPSEGLESVEGNHPWRDRRRKTLGQERSQRLVLPSLDVPPPPAVHHTEAKHMSFTSSHPTRLPQLIP